MESIGYFRNKNVCKKDTLTTYRRLNVTVSISTLMTLFKKFRSFIYFNNIFM